MKKLTAKSLLEEVRKLLAYGEGSEHKPSDKELKQAQSVVLKEYFNRSCLREDDLDEYCFDEMELDRYAYYTETKTFILMFETRYEEFDGEDYSKMRGYACYVVRKGKILDEEEFGHNWRDRGERSGRDSAGRWFEKQFMKYSPGIGAGGKYDSMFDFGSY